MHFFSLFIVDDRPRGERRVSVHVADRDEPIGTVSTSIFIRVFEEKDSRFVRWLNAYYSSAVGTK